jgi:hypothetical protein
MCFSYLLSHSYVYCYGNRFLAWLRGVEIGVILKKESLNSDGQQFHQHKQYEQLPPSITDHNIKYSELWVIFLCVAIINSYRFHLHTCNLRIIKCL